MSTDDGLFVNSEIVLDVLDENALEAVCTNECRASLESLRETVNEACDPEKDVIRTSQHILSGYVRALYVLFSPVNYFCRASNLQHRYIPPRAGRFVSEG